MTDISPSTLGAVLSHVDSLGSTIAALRGEAEHLTRWGTQLADSLDAGQRLLAAGNGGSAAEAQHLTAELVGRFEGDRRAFSAISLHAESSSVTAISNDYGFDEVFARQVRGHARAGDIVFLLSTSGNSKNLLLAAEAAREAGATSWAITGEAPNPLVSVVDDHLALPGTSSNVQEAQLVAVHLICRAFDLRVREIDAAVPARRSLAAVAK
jgi:type III pantothenate kinase